MMQHKPILFTGDMVNAILEGRKTQTRRLNGLDYTNQMPDDFTVSSRHTDGGGLIIVFYDSKREALVHVKCPYGLIGDLLWVRENFATDSQVDDIKPNELSKGEPINYIADESWRITGCQPMEKGKTRPNIFLPKWASRLTLEITDIRVERLQDISDNDALAEGVDRTNTSISGYASTRFMNLWQSINGTDSWNANPWVWVIKFTPHHKNVLDMIGGDDD